VGGGGEMVWVTNAVFFLDALMSVVSFPAACSCATYVDCLVHIRNFGLTNSLLLTSLVFLYSLCVGMQCEMIGGLGETLVQTWRVSSMWS
jgi:hypothetical protein